MKKTFASLIILSICHQMMSMDALAALQTARYQRERYSGECMAYLQTQSGLEIPRTLLNDAQNKYDKLTQGWEGKWSCPPKPFAQCTWNEIEAAFNGNSGILANWNYTTIKH